MQARLTPERLSPSPPPRMQEPVGTRPSQPRSAASPAQRTTAGPQAGQLGQLPARAIAPAPDMQGATRTIALSYVDASRNVRTQTLDIPPPRTRFDSAAARRFLNTTVDLLSDGQAHAGVPKRGSDGSVVTLYGVSPANYLFTQADGAQRPPANPVEHSHQLIARVLDGRLLEARARATMPGAPAFDVSASFEARPLETVDAPPATRLRTQRRTTAPPAPRKRAPNEADRRRYRKFVDALVQGPTLTQPWPPGTSARTPEVFAALDPAAQRALLLHLFRTGQIEPGTHLAINRLESRDPASALPSMQRGTADRTGRTDLEARDEFSGLGSVSHQAQGKYRAFSHHLLDDPRYTDSIDRTEPMRSFAMLAPLTQNAMLTAYEREKPRNRTGLREIIDTVEERTPDQRLGKLGRGKGKPRIKPFDPPAPRPMSESPDAPEDRTTRTRSPSP